MTKITIKLCQHVLLRRPYLQCFIPHCALAFKVFIEKNEPFQKNVLTGH